MAKKAVFGIVKNHADAESLVRSLRQVGFSSNDISVLFPDKEGTRDFAHEKNTKAPEGAVTGAGAGGVAGGTLGLLAGIGALAIPGFGPLIAAGPLLAALSGAAVGAAAGGLAGALIGMGIPEIEAKAYEGKIKDGNILVSVHTEDGKEVDRAKEVYEIHNVSDIGSTMEASVPRPSAPRPRSSQPYPAATPSHHRM
jgi:hypothetical protein